jgi:hypothetical protein
MFFRFTSIDPPATAEVSRGTKSQERFMKVPTLLAAAVLLTSRGFADPYDELGNYKWLVRLSF